MPPHDGQLKSLPSFLDDHSLRRSSSVVKLEYLSVIFNGQPPRSLTRRPTIYLIVVGPRTHAWLIRLWSTTQESNLEQSAYKADKDNQSVVVDCARWLILAYSLI